MGQTGRMVGAGGVVGLAGAVVVARGLESFLRWHCAMTEAGRMAGNLAAGVTETLLSAACGVAHITAVSPPAAARCPPSFATICNPP
jgi:hypothetical protein